MTLNLKLPRRVKELKDLKKLKIIYIMMLFKEISVNNTMQCKKPLDNH